MRQFSCMPLVLERDLERGMLWSAAAVHLQIAGEFSSRLNRDAAGKSLSWRVGLTFCPIISLPTVQDLAVNKAEVLQQL